MTTTNTTTENAFDRAFDRLDDATTWFDREVAFAIDNHEGSVLGKAVEVGVLNLASETIEQAAQAIACARRTCGEAHPGCRSTGPPTTLTVQYENVRFRHPCCVCGGQTDKEEYSILADKHLHGDDAFVCESCLKASAPELHSLWLTLLDGDQLTEESLRTTITTVVPTLTAAAPF